MFKKIVISIIFCFIFIFKVYSDNPKIIDTLEIHNQIKSYGFDEDIIDFKSYFFSSIIFKNDSTIFYNPNSTLHLFEIRLGDIPKVSLISKSLHSGHNFNRHLFIFNDIIYSYGGEGLFNSFPGLIYFDYSSGDWLMKEIKNYPFNSKKVLNSWKIGNKIMVLLNHFSESGTSDFDENVKFSFGEIDLEKFEYVQNFSFKGTYQELLFQSGLGFFRGNYIYDSDYYSLHGYFQQNNTVEYRIFDKISGSLKRTSKLDALKLVNGLSYLYIKGSEIYYRDQNGNIESFNVNAGSVIHSKDFLKLYKSKSNNKLPYYYFISIILISLLILLFIKRRKIYLSKSSSNNLRQELLIIENKLKDLKPIIISKEKLDELFGISHYSYETIKTRRSLIIKNLKENTDLKIDRVRKKSDKRFFDYKIS
jgi:hypothetical protein